MAFKHLEDVIEWAQETERTNGEKVMDQGWVKKNLAECYARLQAMKVMNWRMACSLEEGHLNPAEASAVKVYGTETVIEVSRLLQEIIGPAAMIRSDSPGAQLAGALEQEARGCQINTFGGSVNEIQREIISMAGLRMPRVPR